MATPARCPFYAPNPYIQKEWVWQPQRNRTLIPLLTNQKFFGAGGQVPTKRWQPYLNYNVGDNPSWQWKKPYNLILIQRQLPDDQSWYYNQPNDAPVWQRTNYRNYRLLAPVAFVAEAWHYDYDDSSRWIWQYRRDLPLLATPFVSEAWHVDYNEASLWTWRYPPDLPLASAGTPFVSEAWHYDYNDASFWTGQPLRSTLLAPILTAGGQLPTPEWNDDYNEASLWSWQYPRDLPLLTPNTPFVSEGWHYDINDAAFWTWRAPQSALLTPLLGGRPQPSKAWHYDFNEASNWQRYPYRTSLTFISFGNPFVSLGWHYDYNDSSLWTWPPPQDRTLYLPVTAVTELHFVGFHVNVGIMINKPQD